MKITLRTHVEADYSTVWNGFTLDLLKSISPPVPKLEVLVYEGNRTGDRIHFRINTLGYVQDWTGFVSEHHEGETLSYFVDIGEKLPLGLKKWRHKHEVHASSRGTQIVDRVEYSTGFWVLDVLQWPLVWGQFLYRIPGYKRYFKKNGPR